MDVVVGQAVSIDWDRLVEEARAVMLRAYAPYSNFPVGAAGLVDDGRIITGCNVENAAYGVVLCAECGMVSAAYAGAVAGSIRPRLVAVAVVDGHGEPLMPCGRCRQVLFEAGGPDCLVLTAGPPLRVADLLPEAFGPHNLA